MTKRPTLHDVAELAGVSIKTVSRVVNRVSTVNPDLTARVEAAVAELGYVPNEFARTLKKGSAETIGVIVDSLADPFFAALAHSIEELALPAGYSVIIGTTGFDAERERRQVERMAMQQVDGLVLAPVPGDHTYLEAYRSVFPIVLVDRAIEQSGYDLVAVDDRAVTRHAIEHLLAHGHRRIGFVGSDERFSTTTERLIGYGEALAAANIDVVPELLRPGVTSPQLAEDEARDLLSLPAAPTAIFAANPRAAAGVAHALHTSDRTDVAFVSFGDFPMARTLRPAVTYVDQDPAAIGQAAIERVLGRLDGSVPEVKAHSVLVEAPLVERGSGEVRA